MRPEPRERERVERAPMDGDRDARLDPKQRFGRAPRIEVAASQARSPSPHRQKCDVDSAGELGHLREEIGVARKVEPRAADDPVAECLRGRAEWSSPAVVLRAKRLQLHAADVESFPGGDLHDLVTTAAAHRAETSRRDDPRPPAEAPEGRQVEVLVMWLRTGG